MNSTDLFANQNDTQNSHLPLAVRMRPQTLDDYVGQQHLLGPGKLLRRAIEADRITSLILYGPPGTGKTSLAHLIAQGTRAHVDRLNATISNVAELRKKIQAAQDRLRVSQQRTLLFVDEIHRFNKAQQDVLMPYVEEANPILIGATTHNPFFSLAAALLSRSLVCELRPLEETDIELLLERATSRTDLGLSELPINLTPEASAHLASICDGDARRALNALEVGVRTTPPGPDGHIVFDRSVAEESVQKKAVVYDAAGDAHYDTASAFIKSMRGSDPDATLYWLAKMLYAGEDPRFIARRLVICASEDVGNADPQALVVATSALQAAEFVGLPEARIPLAQAAVYIATAPKSNASYAGVDAALEDVKKGRTPQVPNHLRDKSYPGAKRLGHGEGYEYAHNHEGHHVAQDYLPENFLFEPYYQPTGLGYEKVIKERLDAWRKKKG